MKLFNRQPAAPEPTPGECAAALAEYAHELIDEAVDAFDEVRVLLDDETLDAGQAQMMHLEAAADQYRRKLDAREAHAHHTITLAALRGVRHEYDVDAAPVNW